MSKGFRQAGTSSVTQIGKEITISLSTAPAHSFSGNLAKILHVINGSTELKMSAALPPYLHRFDELENSLCLGSNGSCASSYKAAADMSSPKKSTSSAAFSSVNVHIICYMKICQRPAAAPFLLNRETHFLTAVLRHLRKIMSTHLAQHRGRARRAGARNLCRGQSFEICFGP